MKNTHTGYYVEVLNGETWERAASRYWGHSASPERKQADLESLQAEFKTSAEVGQRFSVPSGRDGKGRTEARIKKLYTPLETA